tara:strand:+ start:336 stop:482 length:147 start_codon:yes stop_codon:yes gene_type:complete
VRTLEQETITLPKPLIESIRSVIKETKLFKDEQDFIEQSIIKTLRRFK